MNAFMMFFEAGSKTRERKNGTYFIRSRVGSFVAG